MTDNVPKDVQVALWQREQWKERARAAEAMLQMAVQDIEWWAQNHQCCAGNHAGLRLYKAFLRRMKCDFPKNS